MTDRELLELAAKAMGLVHRGYTDCYDGDYYCAYNCARGLVLEHSDGSITVWNPLEDDGDALRLAAECKLTVCMDGDASVSAHTAYDQSICFVTQFIKHRECKHAATRRAIVRAAAEIGKARP